jgi:hypothetical protein
LILFTKEDRNVLKNTILKKVGKKWKKMVK